MSNDAPQVVKPAEGSDYYYARLFVARKMRRRFDHLHALREEIASIPFKTRDVGMARIRLQWWHKELASFERGQAEHPVLQSYARYEKDVPQLASAMRAMVAAFDLEIGNATVLDTGAQRQWYQTAFGDFYTLWAPPNAGDNAALLGEFIERAQSLLNLKALARHNHHRLSQDKLNQHALSWDDIRTGTEPQAIEMLIKAEDDTARAVYDSAISTSDRRAREKFLPLWVLSAINAAKLDELRRDGYRVWAYHLDITPIRKLWIAWRTSFIGT